MCGIPEYPNEEMTGMRSPFMDDDGEEFATKLMLKTKKGRSFHWLFKYISRTGEEIGTTISANPLFNEDGTCKSALVMVNYITEKVRLQQLLLNERINKQRGVYGAYCFGNKAYKRYFQEQ